MRKASLLVLVALALILAGCVTIKPTSTPEPTVVPSPTTVVLPTTTTSVEDCTLFSVFPEPRDPASIGVPLPGANDWKLGPSDARMLLIEYSDFQ